MIDYKKKYLDALERANSFQEKYGGDYAGYIFPELRESEDERIRKRLIEYFEGFRMGNVEVRWEGLIVQEVLAWLEKQKEQKSVEIHIDNPNVQKSDPDVKITTSDSSADGKELLYVSNKSYKIGYRDGVASVKSR